MQSILVVDDNLQVLAQVESLLRSAGYAVVATPHARVALEHLRLHSVDLVLTDIFMPDVDGFEVLRTVRRKHAKTCVIAMSADPTTFGVLPAAALLGAFETLQKPFRAAELLRLVESVLVARAS